MAVIDDRLVGYLSLGSSQPDSLAIKRIIEEGLSIRDIKKSLLKGTFDARSYFSRRRTHSAQRMVTTGKLPVADELEKRMQAIRSRALQPGRQEEHTPGARVLPGTDPLLRADIFERNTDKDLQLFADPFVAAPVELDRSRGQRDNTSVDTGVRATMGANANTPAGRGFIPGDKRQIKTSHIIESTLVKAPQVARTGRNPSGSLWSYSSPLPAVKVNTAESQGAPAGNGVSDTSQRGRKGQFKSPPSLREKGKQRQSDAHPSSSLWSYSEKKGMKGH
jgi:hypothetical protein